VHTKCGRAAWRPHELAIQLKSSGIVQATTTWNKDDIRLGTVCFCLRMPIAGAFELAGVTHVLDLNSKAHTCPIFFGLQSRVVQAGCHEPTRPLPLSETVQQRATCPRRAAQTTQDGPPPLLVLMRAREDQEEENLLV